MQSINVVSVGLRSCSSVTGQWVNNQEFFFFVVAAETFLLKKMKFN